MESAGGRRRKGEAVTDRWDPQVSGSGGKRGRCGTQAHARDDGRQAATWARPRRRMRARGGKRAAARQAETGRNPE
jgi:hypothetical protein